MVLNTESLRLIFFTAESAEVAEKYNMGLSEEQGKSKILISSLCGPRRALRLFFLTAEVAEFVEKFLLFFKSKNTKTAKSAKFYAKGAKL